MKKSLSLFLSAALLLALLGACTAGEPENTVNSADPTAGPSASVSPTDAVQEPSLGLSGTEPGDEPTTEPGDEPTTEPGDEPTTEPGGEPTAEPGNEPTTEPGDKPTTEPGNEPTTEPGDEPSNDPGDEPSDDPGDDPEPSESTTPGIPGGGVNVPGWGGWGGGNTDPDPQPSVDVDVPDDPSNVDFEAFLSTISSKYGFPERLSEWDIELVDVYYPGLADLDLIQLDYYIPNSTGGANVTEILLLQVKTTDDGYKAVKILQDRIDSQRSPGAMLYPQDREAWTNSAEVVSSGGCVMLVVNSNYKDIIADFKALF